ncbi:MAG: ABC transporter substrate-binding protein [Bacillota bacterium]|jgi:peptide/nickel transport system substrate-binding protein
MITKKTRFLAMILTVMVFSLLVTGCSPTPVEPDDDVSGDDKYGGWMTLRLRQDMRQPNFYLTRDGTGGLLRGCMHETLFAKDANANLVPRLATGYDLSDDGLTYTVHLREGVKWHDGEEFTADDVVFYYDYHEKVDSVEKSHDYSGFTVNKTDTYTVDYVLKQPDPFFPWNFMEYCVLPEHIWSKIDPTTWDQVSDSSAFVGIGPFKWVEYKVGEYVKVERFDDYWDGKPYLDGIILQFIGDTDAAEVAFESGQVQIMQVSYLLAQKLDGADGCSFAGFPSGNMRVVMMNHADPRLSQLPVRIALSYLMDRESQILANQERAVPMASCFTPADTYYNPSAADALAFEFSVEKAIEVLEDDGWVLNSEGIREKDGQVLDFEMITSIADNPSIVVMIDTCKKAGINIRWNPGDIPVFTQRVFSPERDFELAYNGMTMGPAASRYKGMYSEGQYTTYVNDNIKAKFAEAMAATDEATAKSLWDEIQYEVTKDRAMLWLYSAERIWGTNSNVNLDECGMSGLYQGWINIGKAYFEK